MRESVQGILPLPLRGGEYQFLFNGNAGSIQVYCTDETMPCAGAKSMP